MSQEKIGFIGLGNLGRAIAGNIAKDGFEMAVFDIAGAEKLAPAGTHAVTSVAEVVERSSLVFMCLPTIASVEAVVAEICAASAPDGLIVVNTSTVSPRCAIAAHKQLNEKGIGYADATISGTPPRTRAAQARVMFSGEPEHLRRLTPVFETFSEKVFDLGSEVGNGQRMKLVNNCLVHTALVVSSEALAWGEKGGLSMQTMLEVLEETSGRNIATDHYFPLTVLTGTYDTGATISIARKDIETFVEEARADGCRIVVAESAYQSVKELQEAAPDVDQVMMYTFTRDGGKISA